MNITNTSNLNIGENNKIKNNRIINEVCEEVEESKIKNKINFKNALLVAMNIIFIVFATAVLRNYFNTLLVGNPMCYTGVYKLLQINTLCCSVFALICMDKLTHILSIFAFVSFVLICVI